MLGQLNIASVDISRSASGLDQGASFILCRAVQGYPALPGSVHPVTAAYYRGCETYLPLRFSGAMRQVYVVCLHQDAQGLLRLSYVVDARTARPLVCRSEPQAWRLCRSLS